MAENSTIAFGRYLKMIRGRRNLSLQEVASLSDSFPDPINKGYLSRCENGHQKISLNKVIPLSRIYEVPSDVIVERLELDMEVERLGAPDTTGRTFESLRAEAKENVHDGHGLIGYALFRDALEIAGLSPVSEMYKDEKEQFTVTLMNCASAAKSTGSVSFALHEFRHVVHSPHFSDVNHIVALDQIGDAFFLKNDLAAAKRNMDSAINKAESIESYPFMSFLYGSRAVVADAEDDSKLSLCYYQKAHAVARLLGNVTEEIRHMNNIGSSYVKLGRWRAARRICKASEAMAQKHKKKRSIGYSRFVLGKVDAAEDRLSSAVKYFRAARDVAREMDHKSFRFATELELLKLSLRQQEESHVRAIARRLEKLSPYLDPGDDELIEYRRIAASELSDYLLQ